MKKILIVLAGLVLFTLSHTANAQEVQWCNQAYPDICGHFNQAGSGYGVVAQTINSSAVYGTSSTGVAGFFATNSNDGVHGETSINNMSGVYGVNTSHGYAVAGRVSPAGAGWAIYGDNSSVSGYAGYFHGSVYVSGTLTQASDARLKKDIAPLDNQVAINKLLELHGVSYNWIDENRGQGNQIGFIAQDFEKVFPQWVSVDKDGFKAINERGLAALTVESIRNLKQDNDNLQHQIKILTMCFIFMGMIFIISLLFNALTVKNNTTRS